MSPVNLASGHGVLNGLHGKRLAGGPWHAAERREHEQGGFVGLSGEYDTGGAWVLTAGTEGLVETSGSFQFSGQIGVKGRF
ncbi:hypothetical protein [Nitratireductor sp. XY-223]|uniref:hypothetical protein n=1 Tax=Nitratireductor sp. XY-223 TaxID=2561926 RepID=UPI0010AA1DBE|nr:hypothetical protein [Nitratireductor sp. XY-223]